MFYSGNADIFCKHILRIFDCDGNDYLDFKEFLMAMDIAKCDSGKAKKSNFILLSYIYIGERVTVVNLTPVI